MGWMVWSLNHCNSRRSFSSPECPEWVGHDVDNSPPCGTEVKNSGAVHLLPVYTFMAWTGTVLPLP